LTSAKQNLLAAELQRYFGETCPALVERWQEAIVGKPPAILRELARDLQELEAATNETNRELSAIQIAVFEDEESAEAVLDHAFASLEHLEELAEAMMRRMDELKGLK
jgi:hypothetical protein